MQKLNYNYFRFKILERRYEMNILLQDAQKHIDWLKSLIFYDTIDKRNKANGRKSIRTVLRGEVYWCEFGQGIGSEQRDKRPCVILQTNSQNHTSPNTIVAPITNQAGPANITVPITGTYYYTDLDKNKVQLSGYVLLANTVTISKVRLGEKITFLDKKMEIKEINTKILSVFGIYPLFKDLSDKADKRLSIIDEKNELIQNLKTDLIDKDSEIESLRQEVESLKHIEIKENIR